VTDTEQFFETGSLPAKRRWPRNNQRWGPWLFKWYSRSLDYNPTGQHPEKWYYVRNFSNPQYVVGLCYSLAARYDGDTCAYFIEALDYMGFDASAMIERHLTQHPNSVHPILSDAELENSVPDEPEGSRYF
jgi:hypothetical protein